MSLAMPRMLDDAYAPKRLPVSQPRLPFISRTKE